MLYFSSIVYQIVIIAGHINPLLTEQEGLYCNVITILQFSHTCLSRSWRGVLDTTLCDKDCQ
jgi:hypothetical protein